MLSRRRSAPMVAAAVAVLCPALLTGAGVAAVGLPAVAVRAAAPGGTWGRAEEVPGMAALSPGGGSEVFAVSCASAGDCSAGGYYASGSGHDQAFVVSQTEGIWGMAREVPGSGRLNAGGSAQIASVSCASAGNCSAGGDYTSRSLGEPAFVVSEKNGTWGTARQVRGPADVDKDGSAEINSVSCASAGNCSAGGDYTSRSLAQPAFVVSEKNGTWGTARQIRGPAAFSTGGGAVINSVSCASAGDCSAGGYYASGSGHDQAFVVSQTEGIWGMAREVPGSGRLNAGGSAQIASVSCASAGNCSAGGYYTDGSRNTQLFILSQVNGIWGTARKVPGSGALNKGGAAEINSVSCASAGSCGAGGYYTDGSSHSQAFVASQTHGTWGTAQEVPGSAALNIGGIGQVHSVSCASAGVCSAGGSYLDSAFNLQAFVVSEKNGTWGTARQVPGSGALNKGGTAEINSVSCASAGRCSAGGYYTDRTGQVVAFVVDEK